MTNNLFDINTHQYRWDRKMRNIFIIGFYNPKYLLLKIWTIFNSRSIDMHQFLSNWTPSPTGWKVLHWKQKWYYTEPKNSFVSSTKPKNGFSLCNELETLLRVSCINTKPLKKVPRCLKKSSWWFRMKVRNLKRVSNSLQSAKPFFSVYWTSKKFIRRFARSGVPMGLGAQSYWYPIGTQAINGLVGCPVALSTQSDWVPQKDWVPSRTGYLVLLDWFISTVLSTNSCLKYIRLHQISLKRINNSDFIENLIEEYSTSYK
jgi:hypothetical protein